MAIKLDIKSWLPEFMVSAEADIELLRYFIRTPYLYDIVRNSRWLVLGRKGTGKTSIYEFLKHQPVIFNAQAFSVALNFKDYPWPIHQLYKEKMEGEMSAYHKSWHYLFVTQALSNLIRNNESKSIPLHADLKRAKGVLEKIYGSPFPSIVDTVKSKLFRINKLSLPKLGLEPIEASAGEIGFDEVSNDESLQMLLRSNAYTLLEYFERVLLNNISNSEIVLLLDHLDENWLPDQLQEYSKILINLIAVAASMNTSTRYRNKVRVILFLRSDIFDSLQFNDKNKISQDSSVNIIWDKASLDEMFFARIKQFCPVGVSLKENSQSSSIFEVVRVKQGNTPFAHITKRTFCRPRDVIVFFNKIRFVHKKNNSGLYSAKDLYNAESLLSEHLYNELIDEWSIQKPDLRLMLEAVQAIGQETFFYKDFAQKYVRLKPKTRVAEIQEALRFLFNNSIIGQKHAGIWEYPCTKNHIPFDVDKGFRINPGLKNRLHLAEKRAPRKISNGNTNSHNNGREADPN